MTNVLEAAIKNKKDTTFLIPDSDTRTGELLQVMGLQRLGHDWSTELKGLMRLRLGSKHTVLGKLWVLGVRRVGVYALLLIPDEESKENWRGVALDWVREALSRLQFWKLEDPSSLQQHHHTGLVLQGRACGKPHSGYKEGKGDYSVPTMC